MSAHDRECLGLHIFYKNLQPTLFKMDTSGTCTQCPSSSDGLLIENQLDLLSNSVNYFFEEFYEGQYGEFISGYQGLKGSRVNATLLHSS